MRVILLLFLCIFLNAKIISAEYIAKYGIFGKIAKAKGIYETNQTNYKIVAIVKTLGVAKTLSGNLIQIYTSEGVVKNHILIPLKYTLQKFQRGKSYKREYIFDHKNKIVIKIKYKNGKFDGKERFYYAPNDVLSLYWNLKNYLSNKTFYTFYAIGGRKKDGKIDVFLLQKKELQKIKKIFKIDGLYLKANLYNKIFVGDKGILYLVINPDNFVTLKAMVRNVLKIGDLKGEIVNLNF